MVDNYYKVVGVDMVRVEHVFPFGMTNESKALEEAKALLAEYDSRRPVAHDGRLIYRGRIVSFRPSRPGVRLVGDFPELAEHAHLTVVQ